MPSTLAKEMTVLADGKEICRITDNHRALVYVELPDGTQNVQVRFDESWGDENVGVYAFDVK